MSKNNIKMTPLVDNLLNSLLHFLRLRKIGSHWYYLATLALNFRHRLEQLIFGAS